MSERPRLRVIEGGRARPPQAAVEKASEVSCVLRVERCEHGVPLGQPCAGCLVLIRERLVRLRRAARALVAGYHDGKHLRELVEQLAASVGPPPVEAGTDEG